MPAPSRDLPAKLLQSAQFASLEKFVPLHGWTPGGWQADTSG
jgi:hypothetical protein